jgi:hypothetical protein
MVNCGPAGPQFFVLDVLIVRIILMITYRMIWGKIGFILTNLLNGEQFWRISVFRWQCWALRERLGSVLSSYLISTPGLKLLR